MTNFQGATGYEIQPGGEPERRALYDLRRQVAKFTGGGVTQAQVDISIAAALAGIAKGVVDENVVTADQTGISAVADLNGMSVTWTADPTRTYGVVAYVSALPTVAGSYAVLRITDETNVQYAKTIAQCPSTTLETRLICAVNTYGLSGPQTRKVRLELASGTGTLTAKAGFSNAGFIQAEDVGPT